MPEKDTPSIPKAGPDDIKNPEKTKEGKMEPSTEGEAPTKTPQASLSGSTWCFNASMLETDITHCLKICQQQSSKAKLLLCAS